MTLPKTTNNPFDPRVWAEMMTHFQQTKQAAAAIPLFILIAAFSSLVSAGAMFFEWELTVSIFEKMVGDDSDYFKPNVMGMAAFIVVLTFHYLAEKNKNSGVLRWVDSVTERLAPIYMMGFFLLIAVLLFTDGGIADMLEANTGTIVFGGEQADNGSWLDNLMSMIAAPAASLLFSLAIGSLVVFNIFIAHHALKKVSNAIAEIIRRGAALKTDSQDINTYKAAQKRVNDLQSQIDVFSENDNTLMLAIAGKALSVIQQANQRARKALINKQVMGEAFNPLPDTSKPINTKELEKTVKAIDGITLDTLTNAMK